MAPTSASTDRLAFPVLIGDIGGTNARFALIPDAEAPLVPFQPVATADFPDIETAIEAAVLAHTELRPRSALIDLAGPIDGDAVDLTNAHWVIRPADMIRRLGVEDVVLLNDFEALALALTALAAGGSGADRPRGRRRRRAPRSCSGRAPGSASAR